jgi:PAS domain S-box-containing protein
MRPDHSTPGAEAPAVSIHHAEHRLHIRRASDRNVCRAACRRIVQALPDGVFWLEPQEAGGAVVDFVVGEVNPAGAALLRMAPERMLGRRMSELLDVEEDPSWFQQCLDAWNSGDTNEVTVSLHDPCGRLGRRWFNICGRPLEDGLLVVAHEVTEQKIAERALAQAESRLRQSQAIAHVGSWSYDAHTGRQWWSEETWRILGADPQTVESSYRSFLQFIHPKDRDELDAVVGHAVRASLPFCHEYRIVHKDGTARILRSDGQVERDSSGDVIGYVGTVQDLTHIRITERRARDSEQLRRRILGRLPLILFAIDCEGIVNFAEGLGLQRQGLSQADVLGRSVFELYQDYPDFVAAIRRALAGESLVTVNETRGAVFQRWLEATHDADGRVTGVIGVSMDVTERHLAEQERHKAEGDLRENQMLLRTVIDRMPQGLYVKDLDGRYVLANKYLANFHGLEPEQVLGCTAFDIPGLSPEVARALVEQDHRVAVSGHSLSSDDLTVVRGDGAQRWMRTVKIPLRDADGRVRSIVGFVEDITERKRIQDELEQSRALLQAIFDTFPARIKVEDREGSELLINPAQASLYESLDAAPRSSKAVLGLDSKAYEQVDREIRSVVSEGRSYDYERQRSLLDGQQVCERIMRVPLKDADGYIRGVLNVGIDITEHKATELQLRHAQKMEAMGQLAGGVAHDFNNLLQIMQGYAQLAREAADDPPRLQRALDHVLSAVDRSSKLTRQLLTFSRRQMLKPRKTDLDSLVENLLRMLARLIGEDISLEHRPADTAISIHADPSMIDQVLMNLCVNARDAMPEGGKLTLCTDAVTVDEAFCRLHDLDRPGRYALLTVTDTGSGIEPEHLQRIFEPFFTTKGEGKGTGLGLSIAYGIVRQHGGTLRVHSEPGRGTMFSVYLPVSESGPEAGAGAWPDFVPGGNETLLVAEDEAHVLGLLTELLESQGYEVLAARDGEEALRVFQEHRERIDLIVLDVVMPKLGGRDVVTRIRETKPDARILLSTGYTANAIDEEFVKTHGLTMVEKPYSPCELFKAVRDVLDDHLP